MTLTWILLDIILLTFLCILSAYLDFYILKIIAIYDTKLLALGNLEEYEIILAKIDDSMDYIFQLQSFQYASVVTRK